MEFHDGAGLHFLAERLGSGDGERKTLLTRQIAFEPLPASVLCVPSMGTVLMGFKSPVDKPDMTKTYS